MNNITKKFRPTKFAELVGQPAAKTLLTSALAAKKIPPAYLFSGMRGSGKTTSARLLALALNCEKPQGYEPCGVCQSCKDILRDASPFLVEVDGATTGKAEDIRNLMHSMHYVVPAGHCKVVIIDECHALSKAAIQSSLKTIEEPPPNILFVFCTTEFQKVIKTIVSRCVSIRFMGASEQTLVSMLSSVIEKEGVKADDDAVKIIAQQAHGSIRDAQSILEGLIHTGKITVDTVRIVYQELDPNTVITYFNGIITKDLRAAKNMTHSWLMAGSSLEAVVSGLLEHLRNMLMDFLVEDKSLKKMLQTQRAKIGDARIAEWIQFFYDQLRIIQEYPMEYNLVLDLISIKLMDVAARTKPKSRAKKEEETGDAPETGGKAEASTPKKETVLDLDLVRKLQNVSKGVLEQISKDRKAATIKTGTGITFDIVMESALAKNSLYILESDLEAAVSGYPEAMNTVIKEKEKK